MSPARAGRANGGKVALFLHQRRSCDNLHRMPIYEYYCAENHTVYQFYAKTLAQGRTTPRCPDNPKWKLKKLVSAFAVTKGGRADDSVAAPASDTGDPAGDARMEAAMGKLEREFSSIDENDPRAMGRMMRKMAEATGQPIDGEMEAVVRKLEEGTDPEALEAQLGGEEPAGDAPKSEAKEARHRFRARQLSPRRDPKLYDYD